MNNSYIDYNKKITIGYFCPVNPFVDKRAWSGTFYKIREAIEKGGFSVIWIPTYQKGFLCKLLENIKKRIRGGDRLPIYFWLNSLMIQRRILKKCDMYFFPGGAQIAPYLSIKRPTIYYTDATWKIMLNYYYFDLSPRIIHYGEITERNAIRRCINIRSSNWAASSVIDHYNGNASHNYVLEFGANIDECDIKKAKTYAGGRLNVLFSGVDWKRKGGAIAIDTVEILRNKGVDAHLFFVGINQSNIPVDYQKKEFVSYVGFLDKNNKQQDSKYIEILSSSNIFILPTNAECSAIVFCEASAFGLPIYTYETGGVSNYVINDINGYRLPLNSCADDFANKILDTLSYKKQSDLSNGGRNLYKEKLNWTSWSIRFANIIKKEQNREQL